MNLQPKADFYRTDAQIFDPLKLIIPQAAPAALGETG